MTEKERAEREKQLSVARKGRQKNEKCRKKERIKRRGMKAHKKVINLN
jgi:hypothetical protein